jgi:SRSO17 transposase
LLGRVVGRFGRVEPRRHAKALVLELLADLPRKNCWTIAEHAGDHSPDGMQHLLARAVWDHDAVRDDIRDYVTKALGDPEAGAGGGRDRGSQEGCHHGWGATPVHRHRGPG